MEALKQGFVIMVIGMGTVYIFLSIMIYAMHICAKVINYINKYFPEEEVIEGKNSRNSKKKQNDNDAGIALAIACAVSAKKGVLNK